MSEERIIGLTMYATFGVTVPHVAPVQKYPVLASGRCAICGAEVVTLSIGDFHLIGDEVDVDDKIGHVPQYSSEGKHENNLQAGD